MLSRTVRRARKLLAAAGLVAAAGSSGCLVLNLHPAYDDETIAWDPNLLGTWVDADDKSSIEIERGEWRSYRVRYVHPVEKGVLTAYLTIVGDRRFLDVAPLRGEDRGSFVIPAHAILSVDLAGDRLELTPLSYDWFSDRIRAGQALPGLDAVFDQKDNALIVSPSAALRAWLRPQPPDSPMFGASATFTRRRAAARAVPQIPRDADSHGLSRIRADKPHTRDPASCAGSR